MKSEMIFSGIGGQGVILLGKFICKAAAAKGYSVTLAPAYGQEKRGGRTSCQVVIAEGMDSPVISLADTVLVMDDKSFDDYKDKVKKGGTLIINSSMITRDVDNADIKVVKIPVSDIAAEVGNARAINMVALGAVAKTLDVVTLDDVKAQIKANMKPAIVDVNLLAVEKGYAFA